MAFKKIPGQALCGFASMFEEPRRRPVVGYGVGDFFADLFSGGAHSIVKSAQGKNPLTTEGQYGFQAAFASPETSTPATSWETPSAQATQSAKRSVAQQRSQRAAQQRAQQAAQQRAQRAAQQRAQLHRR